MVPEAPDREELRNNAEASNPERTNGRRGIDVDGFRGHLTSPICQGRDPNRRPRRDILQHRGTTRLFIIAAVVFVAACNPGAKEARDLDSSCTEGNAAACNELGHRTALGDHVLRDWRRASDLYQAACEAGEGEGCVRLARLHVNSQAAERGVAFDSAAAADLLLQGCDQGNVVGCTELGNMYVEKDSVVPDVQPTGVLQDFGRAATLYQRACDAGDLGGCARLGVLYQDGTGVEQDPIHGADLFERACAGASGLGCSHLGTAYTTGTGRERDPTRAVTLFEKACEAEMVGCFNLADMLVGGNGVDQNYDRAVELFQKACDGTVEGDEGSPPVAESCYRLGDLMATGTGVEHDVFRASRLFRRACRLGYQEACRRS